MNPFSDIRGVLLDAARQTERFDYYERLIPDLARWGYNTILLHLFDDDGTAIRLPGFPLLNTPGALSVDQWQSLVRLASSHGIMIIPELECLGHTGYITRLPENADLREPPAAGGLYWSINPSHPGTLPVLGEVMARVMEVFPAPYLHIGMDEADLGGSPESRAALVHTPVWRIFGEHVLRIRDLARAHNRQCLMWGDHVLKHPELRDMLPRDIGICNWLYGKNHGDGYASTMRYFSDAGFSTLGCPSGSCWALFAPEREHMENIFRFSEVCRSPAIGDKSGIINTIWETYTLLPACTHPVMSYGGQCCAGTEPSFEAFFSGFVEDQFGLKDGARESAARALRLLHLGRQRSRIEKPMAAGDLQVLKSRRSEVETYRTLCATVADELKVSLPEVRSRAEEFAQWSFTASFLIALCTLCLKEIDHDVIDPDGRRILLDQWRTTCLQYRSSTGTESEEPVMGQIPRYWQDTDNPAVLLKRYARI